MPYVPPSPYPTVDDLIARLTGAGVDVTKIAALQTGGALEGALLAAIAEWEGAIGWHPYVATLAPETRLFDPPTRSGGGRVPGTRRLDLRAGLLSLESVTVYDSPYTVNSDFYLRAYKAGTGADPVYDAIEFRAPLSGLPQTIAVRGIWGRVHSVPADVKNAIASLALSFIAPDLAFAISGGLFELKIGDATWRYGGTGSGGPLAQQQGAWQQACARLIKREKRITL